MVAPGIGRALDADLGTGAPLEALVERLGDGRWLLLLDNLEQVIEVAGDLEALLARCRGVAILATSRTVLGLRAEREYPVPPLPLPADPATVPVDVLLTSSPAVALFVDRARAVRHDFALTEGNLAAVVEICRRLEGLPLAIELAAARTRLLEPGTLCAEARSWIGQLLPAADSLGAKARAELAWSAAVIANEVGDDPAALAAGQRLAPLLDGIDDPYLRAVSRLAMAWISPIVDDFDGARRAASVSLEQLRGQDEPFWTALALATLGFLETAVGRYDDAIGHLTAQRDLGEQFDNAWIAARTRAQLGTVAVAQGRLAFVEGDPERAALLAGAAEGLRRRVGRPAWPSLRRGDAELVAQTRGALGVDRFDEVFAAGARLNLREAVAAVRGPARRHDAPVSRAAVGHTPGAAMVHGRRGPALS
jgi:hypothetical protein